MNQLIIEIPRASEALVDALIKAGILVVTEKGITTKE